MAKSFYPESDGWPYRVLYEYTNADGFTVAEWCEVKVPTLHLTDYPNEKERHYIAEKMVKACFVRMGVRCRILKCLQD